MPTVIRSFHIPDEVRRFDHGTFEILNVANATLGRASYEPGWRWSIHVGAAMGEPLCQVEHLGIVISGRAAVQMADGTLYEMGPGDVFFVPPGHDSWVLGDEPYVSLHLAGVERYAARASES